jgi:hypothetical protein
MKIINSIFILIFLPTVNTKAQVIALDSTVTELKAKLAGIYVSKRLERNVPFYSPVYIPPVAVSPIMVPHTKLNVIRQGLNPNQPFKFDGWGKTEWPLYMLPNRYDWMSKVRERERH